MEPVKINIFIAYAEADKPLLDKLLNWLYAMRDEVNLWYDEKPEGPEDLSLPWKVLLFWYSRPDPRYKYYEVLKNRFEQAHIYLFLTSHHALGDKAVDNAIEGAVQRQITLGDQHVKIFPVILSACRWQDKSRLARYKPLGPKKPLSTVKPEEDAYMELVDQLNKEISALQRDLNEQRHYRQLEGGTAALQSAAGGKSLPNVGLDLDGTHYEAEEEFRPPEWLGWLVIALIVIVTMVGLQPQKKKPRERYAEPAEQKPPELKRENPLPVQPNNTIYEGIEDTL